MYINFAFYVIFKCQYIYIYIKQEIYLTNSYILVSSKLSKIKDLYI